MRYVEIAAAPALRSLVECYWVISGSVREHRVLPDGCIDVLLAAGAGSADVVGTMTRAIVVPPNVRGAIGIRFRPGEAARLLPHAPRELTDQDAALSETWRTESRVLEDVLSSALDAASDGRIAVVGSRIDTVLSRSLEREAGAVDLRIRAATKLLASGATVRETAEAVCLSERQLARRFEARVGIGPKMFGRVTRLQRAALAMRAGARLSNAAALAGYSDQAHFTRETTALAGVTPRVLAAELFAGRPEVSDSFKTADAAPA